MSASQQLEVTPKLPSQVVVAALKPPCRRDNGEDSDAQHRQANKPNSRQALRYNTKASAAAALPEAEGKKTTDTTREGKKSPSESEPFCSSDHCSAVDAFFLSFSPHGESSERTEWLTSVSSLALLKVIHCKTAER